MVQTCHMTSNIQSYCFISEKNSHFSLNFYCRLTSMITTTWLFSGIPTGNFGNILSAHLSSKMGIPFSRIVCASNSNKILTDFFSTGSYDLRNRNLAKTMSPSIDILVSSNLVKQTYELLPTYGLSRQWSMNYVETLYLCFIGICLCWRPT